MDLVCHWVCNSPQKDGSICAAVVYSKYKFCRKCGAPISYPTCPSCKTTVDPEDTFCIECGQCVKGLVTESPLSGSSAVSKSLASLDSETGTCPAGSISATAHTETTNNPDEPPLAVLQKAASKAEEVTSETETLESEYSSCDETFPNQNPLVKNDDSCSSPMPMVDDTEHLIPQSADILVCEVGIEEKERKFLPLPASSDNHAVTQEQTQSLESHTINSIKEKDSGDDSSHVGSSRRTTYVDSSVKCLHDEDGGGDDLDVVDAGLIGRPSDRTPEDQEVKAAVQSSPEGQRVANNDETKLVQTHDSTGLQAEHPAAGTVKSSEGIDRPQLDSDAKKITEKPDSGGDNLQLVAHEEVKGTKIEPVNTEVKQRDGSPKCNADKKQASKDEPVGERDAYTKTEGKQPVRQETSVNTGQGPAIPSDSPTARVKEHGHQANSEDSNINGGRSEDRGIHKPSPRGMVSKEGKPHETQGGTPYLKSAQPEDYVPPSNMKGNSSTEKYKQTVQPLLPYTNGDQPITVHFYVVLHPAFKYQHGISSVTLRFTNQELGGLKNTDHLMEFQRKLTNNHVLLTYTMPLTVRILRTYIYYSYCVSQASDEESELLPYYPSGSTPKRRLLNVDTSAPLPNDTWTQYDGIALKEKGLAAKAASAAKRMFIGGSGDYDFRKSLEFMFDVLEERCQLECRGSFIISQVDMLKKNMLKWPHILDKDKNEMTFEKILSERIEGTMKGLSKSGKEAEPHEVGRRLGKAMAFVFLINKYILDIKVKVHTSLCEALLVEGDTETGIYRNLEQLTNVQFPGAEKCDDWKTNGAIKVRMMVLHYNQILHALLFYRVALVNELVTFINQVDKKFLSEQWILCVPLLHILSDQCRPYSTPKVSKQHQTEDWWGITGIVFMVEKFKFHYGIGRKASVKDFLKRISDLAAMDPLLWRTALASLSHQHLKVILTQEDVPIDAFLAMLFFHVKMENTSDDELRARLSDLIKKAKTFKDLITGGKRSVCEADLQVYTIAGAVCTDLMNLMMTSNLYKLYDWTKLERMVQIMELSLEVVEVGELIAAKLVRNRASHQGQVRLGNLTGSEPVNFVLLMLESTRPLDRTMDSAEEIKIWSSLYDVYDKNKTRREWLQKRLDENVKERINKLPKVQVLKIYGRHVRAQKHNPMLFDLFLQIACDAAKYMLENKGGVASGDMLDGELVDDVQIGELFSKVLLDTWPKDRGGFVNRDKEAALEHALNQPSFWRILQLFGNTKAYHALKEVCRECLEKVIAAHAEVLEQLVTGVISLIKLKMLLDNTGNFIANTEAIKEKWTTQIPDSMVLNMVLDMKRAEIGAITSHKREVEHLLTMCGTIGVECRTLEAKHKTLSDDLLLKDICEQPMKYNATDKTTVPDVPYVTYFGLQKEVQRGLRELMRLKDSVVFDKIFNETIKEFRQAGLPDTAPSSLTVEDVLSNIWPQSEKKWKPIARRIKDASITVQELDELFEGIKDPAVEVELGFICGGGDCEKLVTERMKQFQRYRQLERCEKGAQIVVSLKEEFGLTGDFRQLDYLLHLFTSVEKTTPLISMSENMVRTASSLATFTDDRTACLRTFISCRELVDWLKQNVQKAQELKTLVDLAFIAASNKGGTERIKVSCLHAAVTAFTPLIYNLRQDAGYDEFLMQCQMIWSALDADPDLPKKLEELDLEWLKGVKEAQGDVEKNALKQVTDINSHGIYIIENQAAGPSTHMRLDDLVRVKVPNVQKDGTNTNDAVYSWGELKELQSQLMLVAGKAEQHSSGLENFVEIFDGVTSLANTFIKICTAGNILFKDWSAKFFCDTEMNVNTIVDFGMAEGKLSGFREQASVSHQITQIRDFVEGCLDDWKAYITKQRETYPELNYYSTEQLVILRKELACLTRTRQPPSGNVFNLLQDIAPICNHHKLHSAFREAMAEMKAVGKRHEKGTATIQDDEGRADDEEEDPKRAEAITHLEEEGYSKRIILQAILKHGLDDKDQLEWACQELTEEDAPAEMKEENEEENEGLQLSPLDYSVLQTNETLGATTHKYIRELSAQHCPLAKKLRDLWKMYLESTAMSMADYFSVEHVGLLLHKVSEKKTLNRHHPPYVQSGKPNLIVCSRSEVHIHVLSLFMEDEALPLPDRGEVLMCTENTTLEEVELLLWRAVQDKSGGIHVLVNADQINYEVAAKVERAIECHLQGHDDYRFIVVCSAEKEDQAVLVAALDSYRAQGFRPQSVKRVSHYVKQHLSTAGFASATPSSMLDPESFAVRIVRSDHAGAGKSLWVRRKNQLFGQNVGLDAVNLCISLPLHGTSAQVTPVIHTLLPHVVPQASQRVHRLIHIDIPHEMNEGVDHLLFNLVILGSLVDPAGHIWRRSALDYYLIEIMPLLKWEIGAETRGDEQGEVHQILELLPSVTCRSPQESLKVLQQQENDKDYVPGLRLWNEFDQLMDYMEFLSVPFQRVYQYLQALHRDEDLREVDPYIPRGSPIECLVVLLRYCGLEDPSWAELVHFINFLNQQLSLCEQSNFCAADAEAEEFLPGFLQFIVRFMIQMSRDFSTRSLKMAQDAPGHRPENAQVANVDAEIQQFQLKRRWEQSPHPYIFFNPDETSLTFLGFMVDKRTFDIIDAQTKQVLEHQIMSQELYNGLKANQVRLNENFDDLTRREKLSKLCMVMGVDPHDPDDKYVLTTDNVMKILAIQMRFRCGIPVVIMGETGCGKTHLIKFMCSLQVPHGSDVKNMILMKVHGGTTEEDILRKVEEASALAENNRRMFPNMYTVLFLDEVNTTEALGLVKEVLCDFTIKGQPLNSDSGLKLIAACNPYKKHSDDVIEKLEKAGLGYHVRAEETRDKLGRIPMRRLVYRVQPLPQSLLPLVWDFGQLNITVERLYINQIVSKKMMSGQFGQMTAEEIDAITNILVAAQTFMRNLQDECSFVSLRDVERVMEVLEWFYKQLELFKQMDILIQTQLDKEGNFRRPQPPVAQPENRHRRNQLHTEQQQNAVWNPPEMETKVRSPFAERIRRLLEVRRTTQLLNQGPPQGQNQGARPKIRAPVEEFPPEFEEDEDNDGDSEDDDVEIYEPPGEVCRALILALGVCYHACLQERREDFRNSIAEHFIGEFSLDQGPHTILQNISVCQDVFLNALELKGDIAKNEALKENVFMMVVCIELRIPLFLVGKPGSSKSLAKTIVVDAMQGRQSKSKLFREFKEVTMLSYQCSPLSTPDGIISMFEQCALLQKEKKDKFVAVVVLDEVGLAEDSPRMPLKALHALLEDGSHGDQASEEHMKVGFIGISNWALDPAKMNRGILVQRGPPDEQELQDTAKGICSSSSDRVVEKHMNGLIQPLAKAYLELYNSAVTDIREFFGLRDFYSLVKMLHGFAKKNGHTPTWHQLEHAILRNFGGLDKLLPMPVFAKHMLLVDKDAPKEPNDPDNSTTGLIKASLSGNGPTCETRYLLLLTENYAALSILMQNMDVMQRAIIIFGSSFPKDQEYTVVCRNINRIKVCMETGQTVVLLNLENLYESLYDALNQYYTDCGGNRLVDLGLGSHRVKACVHKDFKLLVVAEKEMVYKNFPIPLINRLEKHFLAMSTMLTQGQKEAVEKLQGWAKKFVQPRAPQPGTRPTEGDAFVGYHPDMCASIVLQVCHETEQDDGDETWVQEVFEDAKKQLLWCATPESVVQTKKTMLFQEEKKIADIYLKEQEHESLAEYLKINLHQDEFIQVTTHSRILNKKSVAEVAKHLDLPPQAVMSESLHVFNTEQQFSKLFRTYFSQESETDEILIIQCDSGDQHAELIACARYIIMDEYKEHRQGKGTDVPSMTRKHVVLIIQLPRITGGCFTGLEGGRWRTVYLDDLRMAAEETPEIDVLKKETISSLVGVGMRETESPMDVDGEEEQESLQVQDEGPLKPRMDFTNIVQRCILPATSMVRDQGDHGSSTTRMAQLFTLFAPEKETGLSCGATIQKRLYSILHEKEQTHMNEEMARNWLVNDAASSRVINKGGTFRRAISMSFDLKVTPILAGLIAYMDTNNNLSIMTSDGIPAWKKNMWLSMIRDPAITPLSYKDLLSAKKNTELTKMTVLMYGAEGQKMDASLPFSWLIRQQINMLIHQKSGLAGFEILEAVSHLLRETACWSVVESAFAEAGEDELVTAYLDDFVKMVYRPQSSNHGAEHELVKKAIRTTMRRMEVASEGSLGEMRVEHWLPLVHIAESAIHRRLQLFSQVVQCCPDIADDVWQFHEEETEHELTAGIEMTLDILTLHLVLEKLQPTVELLRDAQRNKKWHEQISQLEPLINDVLSRSQSLEGSDLGSYGDICTRSLADMRNDHNRIALVKLFVDIVSPRGSDQEKNCTKTCPNLWKKLANADFKQEVTMKKIEEFLFFVTKNACEQYMGEAMQCALCKDSRPDVYVLPCKHKVCEVCMNQLDMAEDFCCPQCKKPYGRDVKRKQVKTDTDKLEKLQSFKSRCNSFLMEVVSRYCFVGDIPPEPGVVKMLMNYITRKGAAPKGGVATRQMARTKQMNLFNDNLDPTPVIRSVLLQLLLRSSVSDVQEHLVNYFNRAEQFLSEADRLELAIIYTQCFEDHYHSAISMQDPAPNLAQTAGKLLGENREQLTGPGDPVARLEAIAKIRVALSITADLMAEPEKYDLQMSTRVFHAARRVCDNRRNWDLPGIYLIRLLARRHGVDTLNQVAAKPGLTWVLPDRLRPREDATRSDVLVVCGEDYRQTRQALIKVLVNHEDVQELQDMMAQIDPNTAGRSRAFLLALFSIVTTSYAGTDRGRQPSREALETVQRIIQESPGVRQKELAEALLTNSLADQCGELKVIPDMPPKRLIITEIISHFGITMATVRQPGLLHPFFTLVENPQAMRNIYFPTMPEDHRAEIMDALLDGRTQFRNGRHNENPVLYECPNGHPYIIGNCGRPAYTHNCRYCGAVIGGNKVGRQYRLHSGRQVHNMQDITQPGHVLGDSADSGQEPVTERELSPTSLVLTRLLLHLSLYTGANTHIQAIRALITPEIPENTVTAFLWMHIENDLWMLRRAVGKGKDDCVTLVHLFINTLLTRQVEPRVDTVLDSRGKRKAWEREFSSQYITPFLNDIDPQLRQANHLIANDKRLGPNPLLKLIHETEDNDRREGAAAAVGPTGGAAVEFEHVPALWRFRTRVTVEHLRRELYKLQPGPDHQNQHHMLRLFLEKEPELRVVQLLPSILHFIRMLRVRFHRKIDRADAEVFTVGDIIENLHEGAVKEEYEAQFADLCTAWKAVRPRLSTHVVSDNTLPAEYCDMEMGRDTPLSALLPGLRGRGLCSLALIHYLTTVHNQFIEDYHRLAKTKPGPEVSFIDVTSVHLITYDLDRDLLPLVLANCTYALAVGHGTRIEYNFTGLEQQLKERFIRGRPPLIFQLEPVTFSEDMTNVSLFANLEKKTPQVALAPAVQTLIRNSLRDIVEVTDCVSNLNYTIEFLVSVGGQIDTKLQTFMTDILQMENTSLSPKARIHCELQHTRSLWLLYSFEREKLAARHKQEAFTSVDAARYKEPLTDEQKQGLEAVLKHMNLPVFLTELYECIVMQLTVRQNPNDEDYVDNTKQKLNEALYGYIESKDGPEIHALTSGAFPEVTVDQCVEVWRATYTFSTTQRHL